jgi:hypothetical protein
VRWLARQHKLLLLHARLHLLLISGLFCSTAVALCVPMGLIAWTSAGSFCITDLSLQVRKMSLPFFRKLFAFCSEPVAAAA